jgi:methyl-accepting chemotaxis protein
MQRLKDIKIGPRFFGLLGIIFVCIAIVYLVSRAGLNSMISSAKAVQHTHEVINAAGQITQNLLDMETGLRGFMLTGEDDFLAPYYKGLDELQRNINKTKELLADNPKLTYRIGRIEKLANQWVQEIGEYSINLRREVDNGQLPENVLVNAAKGLDVDGEALRPVRKSGKDAMIEIRDLILELITVERNLLEVRHRQSTDTARFVNISILCTALIVILISSCFGWFMVNHLKKSIQTAFDFSNKVANGNYYESFTVDQKDEIGLLINNIHRMTDQLRKAAEANKKRQWTS